MTVHEFYRLAIWLPLVVPVGVAAVVHGLGIRPPDFDPLRIAVQVLLGSLLYGGVPYALLALWATWWVGGRSEPEITRLMMRAPFLMVAVFVVVAAIVGMVVGQPVVFLAVAGLGTVIIIPLGYAYVGLVWLLRQYVDPRPA